MSKPNVVLLHGRWPERIDGDLIKDIPLCDPNDPGNWMGWLKKQLEEQGYSVSCPIVVDAWKARYEEWKRVLDQEEIDENTIFLGHSAGGYVALRYIGESGIKVKKVILVAPGAPGMERDDSPLLPYEEEFYKYEITPKLREQISEPLKIFVSNDWDFILRAVEYYKKIFEVEEIKIEGKEHFSFLQPTFKELLDEIVEE